ncbi:lantibiotic dehydratase [Nonomuraea muscovyensis]|uniref:lantibiotic dehydratase n=1 Tax=Nonomuraea muscovyensis TaxID=1124761 RepID=UPI001C86CA87
MDEWADRPHAWMSRFRVPDRVLLAEDDQHLPLDLRQDMHLDLLRAHLDASRTGVAVLHDAPPPDADGWIGGRAHSLVIPLTDPACLDRITDATLCHGWAGLLAVARAVAGDSPAPDRFAPVIDDLTGRLAADLDRLPKPGFIEARVGAHLALDGTNTTGWTRALLVT